MHRVEAGSDAIFWPAVSAKELKATNHSRNRMLRLRYLALAQAFSNNQWVHRMQQDIGLITSGVALRKASFSGR
jgi:hypothetical protein